MLDDTPTNDNELHQSICNHFKIDYYQEMDIITTLKCRLECKINYTLPALLPNNINTTMQGLVTSSENTWSKRAIPALAIIQGVAAIGGMMIKGVNALVDAKRARAIPALAIIQGVAAIGGMMIKGVNALVDAKRASSFDNAIKLVNKNVQITHDRLITLENRTAMMTKAIIPVLKDFKEKINNTKEDWWHNTE